ncbi:hypothetical protein BDC45DRAFT_517751 [Circinella umbellata]|nr:hypothetical protein BDC45DRAFT_517751 [Circinella umbellata]
MTMNDLFFFLLLPFFLLIYIICIFPSLFLRITTGAAKVRLQAQRAMTILTCPLYAAPVVRFLRRP